MSLYNTSGQINLTPVTGSAFTGLYANDGSWNIVLNDGLTWLGYYHPCGAINAVQITSLSNSAQAPNGSLYVFQDTGGNYHPVFGAGTGTISTVTYNGIRADPTYITADATGVLVDRTSILVDSTKFTADMSAMSADYSR